MLAQSNNVYCFVTWWWSGGDKIHSFSRRYAVLSHTCGEMRKAIHRVRKGRGKRSKRKNCWSVIPDGVCYFR